jgi:uncharacterized phiE125 gp8 family phage protein
MPGLKLILAPDHEPITLIEARLHLRLDATGSPASHPDDALVTSLIKAARQHIDGKDGLLSRALITQTWELQLDGFPVNEIRLALPPLQSVSSVKYDDTAGVEQTVATANYAVDAVTPPGWVIPITGFSWPATMETPNAVRIRFVAGYGNAAAVPEPIKAAMKLLIGHLYENREEVAVAQTVSILPMAAEALLSPYVFWTFA